MSDSPTHHLSDSLMLDEHDINEFRMSHSSDEYPTNNFEEIEYQDLDCTNEEVMTTEETIIMERSDHQLMEHIEIDNDPDQEAEHDIIQQLQRESDEGIEHEYDNHEIEYETDEVEAALDPDLDADFEADEEQDDVVMTEPRNQELIEEEDRVEEEKEEEEEEGLDESDELDADEISSPQVSYTNTSNQNIVFQAKPTFQKISTPNISVKPIPSQSSQSQNTFMIVPDGQGSNQVLKISHASGTSQSQLQSFAQSIITAKTPDGHIIHLRSAQTGKPLVATSQGANVTIQNVQNPKIMTNTIKRTIQNTNQQQNRNLYTKMLLSSGNQQGQEIYVPANSKDNQQQTYKYYTTTSSSGNDNTNSTKSMSINQPQMSFVQQQPQQQQQHTVSKVQNIIPMTTTPKQYVYSHKIGQSTAQPPKLSVIPSKSLPTKILPAPIMTTQIRPANISNSQQMQFTTAKNPSQQNPHKVFIRQASLKPGTVFGSGHVIRIPSNQNIINSNQVHQIQQIPGGKQVQLVRIVNSSSSSSSSSSSPSTSKPKTQTMGVTQRMGCVPQQLLKVVPINASNQQQLRHVAPKTTMSGTQRILIPATSMNVSGQNKNTVGIPASRISQLTSGQTILSTNSNVGNIVLLPSGFMQQQQQQQHSQNQQHKQLKHRSAFTPPPKDFLDPNKPTTTTTTTNIYKSLSPKNSSSSIAGNLSTTSESSLISAPSTPTPKSSKTPSSPVDSNGVRQRKPCNCTKSQCLKLYCDCFANGEFCNSCNCTNCSNNLVNEEERQKAIKLCLERNPNAFRPKIGKARESGDDIRRHNKGCNCKRSGCLKNYCECYEAKIACSGNCKCIGCRNVEEPVIQDNKALKDLADAAEARTTQIMMDNARMRQFPSAFRPSASSNTGLRQPFNFLTDKVIESTCQCLLAQAEDAERGMFDEETSQRLIIEEFGRCFKEIIETAQKVESTNT